MLGGVSPSTVLESCCPLHGRTKALIACNAAVQIKPPANLLLSSEEEHQMVPCMPYRGSTGSGGQPFRIAVHPHAQLMMDFHSHLCSSEVIGVLGGTWDADARLLR